MNTDNGIKGPVYFDGLTENIQNPLCLEHFEWRRQLKSRNGNTKFKIKFYGDLLDTLIVSKELVPQKVIAIDIISLEEIILFDGCQHGYNAMFCDTYTIEEINNRETEQIYQSKDDNEIFEVILSAYYQTDYEVEFSSDVDEAGMITLINGEQQSIEDVKRNGFDVFGIDLIDKGQNIELISEECA